MFDDLLAANQAYLDGFSLGDLQARAAKGLAVVTCIDSRIEPLAMLGLVPGDAKIVRNAGGRVTDDALRSLVLASHLLGVDRVAVIQHTRCAMTQLDDDALRARIAELSGADTTGWEPWAIADQHRTLAEDVARVRSHPLIPDEVEVGAFIYDVATGSLEPVEA